LGQVFYSRTRDPLGFNRTQLWYWMLMTRAYWRLEEVFGYNIELTKTYRLEDDDLQILWYLYAHEAAGVSRIAAATGCNDAKHRSEPIKSIHPGYKTWAGIMCLKTASRGFWGLCSHLVYTSTLSMNFLRIFFASSICAFTLFENLSLWA